MVCVYMYAIMELWYICKYAIMQLCMVYKYAIMQLWHNMYVQCCAYPDHHPPCCQVSLSHHYQILTEDIMIIEQLPCYDNYVIS